MNVASLLPLGKSLLSEGLTRTTFEWGRIQNNSDWILPVAVFVMAVLFVVRMYRRDASELTRRTRLVLTLLRISVFLSLLLLYLQPQWRTEIERMVNSRVVLLVDTSLSMGMADAGSESDASSSGADTRTTRADYVAKTLGDVDFVSRVQDRHDLAVFRFDESVEAVALIEKRGVAKQQQEEATGNAADEPASKADTVDWADVLAPRGAQTRLCDALVDVIQEQQDAPLAAVICISDGCQNVGAGPRAAVAAATEAGVPVYTIGVGSQRLPVNVRVADFIVPARAYPGDEYTVSGFVQGYRAAARTVTVELLQRVAVDGSAAGAKTGSGQLVERRQVTLGGDGEVVPVKFELTPKALGRQTLCLKVSGVAGDVDPADNMREADVEIVDRKCRVLLLAGGPSREYRFLRNMLHRDESVEVDVLLQTAQVGMSQDAAAVLDDFPDTRARLFKYDCVVALDPDWRAFTDGQLELLESWVAEQGGGLVVAAGAVHMGNPIDSWIGDERMDTVRALYPVTFHRRFAMQAGSHAAKEPWPLSFTREGLEEEFLWLADDAEASQAAWADFPGLYSYYPVAGAKPGGTVFARFSDPTVASGTGAARGSALGTADGGDKDKPVYFAGQFFGSGRVFYMGSSEMWRLRRVDEAFFETFYTKLIRHLSQGRLLRGSSRGTLMVGRDRYVLGNTAEIRARLTDAELKPLEAADVELQVIAPDGSTESVLLKPDPRRNGTFAGRVPLIQEGAYRFELPIPESNGSASDNIRLTRRVQVKMPDLERRNSQRNDALMSKIATQTGGQYYTDVRKALAKFDAAALPNGNTGGRPSGPLLAELKDRTKTIVHTVAPDRLWRENWLLGAMILICGLLSLEWVIRRLMKLA